MPMNRRELLTASAAGANIEAGKGGIRRSPGNHPSRGDAAKSGKPIDPMIFGGFTAYHAQLTG